MSMLNYYKLMKDNTEVHEKLTDFKNYNELGYALLGEMFDYSKEIYKGFFYKAFEFFLANDGFTMTIKKGDGLVTVPCEPEKLPNENGQFLKFRGHDLTGNVYEGVDGVNCVVCYNMGLGLSDRDIIDYASNLLTETDVTLKTLLLNARSCEIPIAKDSKTKRAIEETLKLIQVGKPAVILDTNILEELESGSALNKMSLTDTSLAEKIQYVSRLHDDLLRRYLTLYGHNLSGSEKLAQQTIKEISNSESFSFLVPLMRYKNRLEWLKRIKEMFPEYVNKNATIDFSLMWKLQLDRYIMDNEEKAESVEDMEEEKTVESEVVENEDRE